MDSRPIGIFDSGVGGLTVARAIADQLPHESIYYLGDTAHAPYGPRTADDVRQLSKQVADQLVSRGIKLLVIACNTATSVFLEEAQRLYADSVVGGVVGVIEPAVSRAVQVTKNSKVAVLGTEGTIRSGEYQRQLTAHEGIECFAEPAPLFVEFAERGITTGRQILGVAEAYASPLQQAGVDTCILGCTHYPLLTGVIQLALGDPVTLISSSEETAKRVVRLLIEQDLVAPEDNVAQRRYETTGDPRLFAQLASRFAGAEINWFDM
ncbi:glutamate racemase [Corynebacterium pyruviciproducens]|uniref:Glutamate racemase n=1 Tax=Corynebacterium pyruviciproducens ATCC BAA-1742 TaxID=1125779 RepID=S2ZZ64_9CORY|nr:glutamate racemase [Corynebacterium pyruviciproducens]EPD69389.1 glutamate racemase [Corynebacterium pyruviciproducens ATCC BAA-1742]